MEGAQADQVRTVLAERDAAGLGEALYRDLVLESLELVVGDAGHGSSRKETVTFR